MYGKEASNRKQEIDRQHHTIPNQRSQRPKDKHYGKIKTFGFFHNADDDGIPLIHSYLFPNCNNADVIHIFFAALVLLAPMVLTQWRCSQMAIYNRQPILKLHDLFPCRLSRRPDFGVKRETSLFQFLQVT